MNQRFQALQELGEQLERAIEAAEASRSRSANEGWRVRGQRLIGRGPGGSGQQSEPRVRR